MLKSCYELSSLFLDEIKNRVSVSTIVGSKVKLVRRGREFVGLSPFKSERTPSFTVNDDKQFYHCFATGKHGSVFDFLMETEGLSFIESVERLASKAGLSLPEQDLEQDQKYIKKMQLIDVNAKAAHWFHKNLMSDEGRKARDYLVDRGITQALIEQFNLGYASTKRQGLITYLKTQNITIKQMLDVGLVIQPDDGRPVFERFSDRLMFPIGNERDEIIAFGGRALSKKVQAKYLNSPETSLFHKGNVLYGFNKARQAAYKNNTLCVVEGYMDVISLAGGGFIHSVAPLGTAITGEQITLLWKLAKEPILCFDGDSAGLQAAYRLIDKALPLLQPSYSLNFAILPQGKDPDDMIREYGAAIMQKNIDEAFSMIDMLVQREVSVASYDTPERRAALSERLRNAVKKIQHQDIRKFYGEEIKTRLENMFQKKMVINESRETYKKYISPASYSARHSNLVKKPQKFPLSEAMIIMRFMNYIDILITQIDEFEEISLNDTVLDRLRYDIIELVTIHGTLDRQQLKGHLLGCVYKHDYREIITQLEQLPEARMLSHRYPNYNREIGIHTEEILSDWQIAIKEQCKLNLERELTVLEKQEPTDTILERLIAIRNEMFNFDE